MWGQMGRLLGVFSCRARDETGVLHLENVRRKGLQAVYLVSGRHCLLISVGCLLELGIVFLFCYAGVLEAGIMG